MVKRNTTNIFHKEYHDVIKEYGKFVKKSVIQKGNYVTPYEVYNVYTIKKIPDPDFLCVKKRKIGISVD